MLGSGRQPGEGVLPRPPGQVVPKTERERTLWPSGKRDIAIHLSGYAVYSPPLVCSRIVGCTHSGKISPLFLTITFFTGQVAYSAMHGVGDQWARRVFEAFSLPPFLSVASQRLPDPQFPTVEYPNPEEQGALKEAIRLAEEKGNLLGLSAVPGYSLADRLLCRVS